MLRKTVTYFLKHFFIQNRSFLLFSSSSQRQPTYGSIMNSETQNILPAALMLVYQKILKSMNVVQILTETSFYQAELCMASQRGQSLFDGTIEKKEGYFDMGRSSQALKFTISCLQLKW